MPSCIFAYSILINITFSLLVKISFVSVSPFTTRSIIHKLSFFVVQNIIESIWNVIRFFNVSLPTQTKRHCPVSQPLGELVSTDKFEALTNSTGRTSPKQGLWEFLVLPENQQLAKTVRETCDKSQHCQKSKQFFAALVTSIHRIVTRKVHLPRENNFYKISTPLQFLEKHQNSSKIVTKSLSFKKRPYFFNVINGCHFPANK